MNAKKIMEKIVAMDGMLVSPYRDGMHYDISVYDEGISIVSNDHNRTFALDAEWEDVQISLKDSKIVLSGNDQDDDYATWEMTIVIPIQYSKLG